MLARRGQERPVQAGGRGYKGLFQPLASLHLKNELKQGGEKKKRETRSYQVPASAAAPAGAVRHCCPFGDSPGVVAFKVGTGLTQQVTAGHWRGKGDFLRYLDLNSVLLLFPLLLLIVTRTSWKSMSNIHIFL